MSPSTAGIRAAGRELDQLVSDAVFGPWDESRCRVCGWPLVPDGERGCWHDNCSMRYSDNSPYRISRADEPRPYSTDIAAAWEVVEKLRELARAKKLWGPNLAIHVPVQDGGRWVVELHNDLYGGMAEPHTHDTQWSAGAETAPLAICLAALRAVGAEPPEGAPQSEAKS